MLQLGHFWESLDGWFHFEQMKFGEWSQITLGSELSAQRLKLHMTPNNKIDPQWLEEFIRKTVEQPLCRNRAGCSTCGGSMFYKALAEATNLELRRPANKKLDTEAMQFILRCLADIKPIENKEALFQRESAENLVEAIIIDYLRYYKGSIESLQSILRNSWAGHVFARRNNIYWPVPIDKWRGLIF
jgi:hypothetical protein